MRRSKAKKRSGKPAVARALDKLFQKKNKDGSRKYTIEDVHAIRSVILMEIGRREDLSGLDDAQKRELAILLDLIGINEKTDPDLVPELVERYFKKLELTPGVFDEVGEILQMYTKKGDRIEAMAVAEKEYRRQALKAPTNDEDTPENAENAQSFTLAMGNKVRL